MRCAVFTKFHRSVHSSSRAAWTYRDANTRTHSHDLRLILQIADFFSFIASIVRMRKSTRLLLAEPITMTMFNGLNDESDGLLIDIRLRVECRQHQEG